VARPKSSTRHGARKVRRGVLGSKRRVRVVKAKGEFVWHKHDDMNEIFLVTKGELTIRLRDRDVDPRI
jgi:quercetin dioxygenase-like cupin family protein